MTLSSLGSRFCTTWRTLSIISRYFCTLLVFLSFWILSIAKAEDGAAGILRQAFSGGVTCDALKNAASDVIKELYPLHHYDGSVNEKYQIAVISVEGTEHHILFEVEKRWQQHHSGPFSIYRGSRVTQLPSACHFIAQVSYPFLNMLSAQGSTYAGPGDYFRRMVVDPGVDEKRTHRNYALIKMAPIAGTSCVLNEVMHDEAEMKDLAVTAMADVGGILIPFGGYGRVAGAILLGSAGGVRLDESAYHFTEFIRSKGRDRDELTQAGAAALEGFLYLAPVGNELKHFRLPNVDFSKCKPCLQFQPVPALCAVGDGAEAARLTNGIFTPFEIELKHFGHTGGGNGLSSLGLGQSQGRLDKWAGLVFSTAGRSADEVGLEIEKSWIKKLVRGSPTTVEKEVEKYNAMVKKFNRELLENPRAGVEPLKKIKLPDRGPWSVGIEQGVDIFVFASMMRKYHPDWDIPFLQVKGGPFYAKKFLEESWAKYRAGQAPGVIPVVIGEAGRAHLDRVASELKRFYVFTDQSHLTRNTDWEDLMDLASDMQAYSVPINRSQAPHWLSLNLDLGDKQKQIDAFMDSVQLAKDRKARVSACKR